MKKYSLIFALLAFMIMAPILALASDYEPQIGDSMSFTDSLEYINPSQSISVYDTLAFSESDVRLICYGCYQYTTTIPGGPAESVEKFLSDEVLGTNTTFSLGLTMALIPLSMLVGVIAIGVRLGMTTKLILPIGFFLLMGMAYIGLLPSWIIMVGIVIIAAVAAYMVSRFMGDEQS